MNWKKIFTVVSFAILFSTTSFSYKGRDLSYNTLATWGSSVCDGAGAFSGAGWAHQLEKKLHSINGPIVLHRSTPGHNTDRKETWEERDKVRNADFVMVCLSLGNQGLERAGSNEDAQGIVNWYLDDLFHDRNPNNGDPISIVNYIKSIGAIPIVTLAYPKGDYNSMHCRKLVEANIIQQNLGVATINHLGTTNAGDLFGPNDCQWADGGNAPINGKSDPAHPNQVGHDENFYAFPPDLPFALKDGKPFPKRPSGEYSYQLTNGDNYIFSYTPEFEIHNYTLQYSYKTRDNGIIGAIHLGPSGVMNIVLENGKLAFIDQYGTKAIQNSKTTNDNRWHNISITYSYVRQAISLYSDGEFVGSYDTRSYGNTRKLFPTNFLVGGSSLYVNRAKPGLASYKDIFINRSSLHSKEVKERATTKWVGAGSLDIYVPLNSNFGSTAPIVNNLAQTLQTMKYGKYAMKNPYGRDLYLRGSMNSWEASAPMKYRDDGVFAVKVNLSQGDYEFKFADAQWKEGTNFGRSYESHNSYIVLDRPMSLQNGSQSNLKIFVDRDGEYLFELDPRRDLSRPELKVSRL